MTNQQRRNHPTRYIVTSDDDPCPQCGAENQLETQDGITICYACGWQHTSVACSTCLSRYPEDTTIDTHGMCRSCYEEMIQKEKATVDLIASGYEWTCPHCNQLNHEMEIVEQVTCEGCEARFDTNPAEHAYG